MYYTYQELRKVAMSDTATAEDRIRLYPVYEYEYDEDGEIESVKLVDAVIR